MNKFRRDDRGGRRRDFGRRDFGDRRDRQMFKTVCSNCGRECEVPFRPSGDKPVYCDDCFKTVKRNGDSNRFEGGGQRRDGFSNAGASQNQAQFDAINSKLNRILEILAPAPPKQEEVKKEPVKPEEIKPTESVTKPAKKAAKKASPKKKASKKSSK